MPESGGQARQWLERQLEELGSLFNAGARSPNFREWRQATLTCIQRIWPAEPARSERFRRIPFSAPMGRPAEREVREYFERGCGEALGLLKDYIAEVVSGGVPDSGAASAPSATAPPGPGADDDGLRTVELPGPAAAAPARPRLKDLLGFSDDSSNTDVPHAQPPRATGPAVAAGAPPSATPAGDAATMAGLESQGFFAPPTPAARGGPGPGPGSSPAGSTASVPSSAAQPRLVVTGAESAAGHGPPAPHPQDTSSAAPERAATPRSADPPARPGRDQDDLERVAEELLRASSTLSALPRRTGQDRRANTREFRSPVALAVAALATEVEALGVPEGHHARARAVLLDLSRRLDEPNLSWEMLREAVSFVMEFPGLGRRVVPLLLPYLDRAA